MINLKVGGIIAAAFLAGAFIGSPDLRAYAANTVRSIDIVNETIQSVDIKNGEVKTSDIGAGQVTNSDLAAGAVNSAKVADGSIVYADVSRALIAVESRIDCNCGGTGWDPDGTSSVEFIYDDRIRDNSVVAVTVGGNFNIACSTWGAETFPGNVAVKCGQNIPEGMGISFAVFNNPAYG